MTSEASALGSGARPAVVVKVGGSLFDWPDLKSQLPRFLAGLSGKTVVVVPGGGKAADAVRDLDQRFNLGEVISHWLALRALTLNAHFLAELLPGIGGQPEKQLRKCPAAGSELLDAALRDRFYFLLMDYLPNDVEKEVLVKKTGITAVQADARVATNRMP